MSQIHGYFDPAFQAVRDSFVDNFERRGEVGASCAVHIGDRRVVDLWGGTLADQVTPWSFDTISIFFSCTKAATALCAHILIDRGQLDLDARVTQYWPEFGAQGKANTTVRDMLTHASGVPALRGPVKVGGYLDFDYMAQRLADEIPFWEPGTAAGYHLVSFGWTVGELVRRVSGMSLGAFFKAEVAHPLGLDFHIGLPQAEHARMSKLIPFKPGPDFIPTPFVTAMQANSQSLQALAFSNNGGWKFDDPESWESEIGGAGGAANARALAGMFAALLPGRSLLSRGRIDDMRRVARDNHPDLTLSIPTRFGQGFMLNIDNRDAGLDSVILGDGGFGHVGMGGSLGFADPEANMAFGYTMNKMGGGILLNPRGQSLVDAAYSCL